MDTTFNQLLTRYTKKTRILFAKNKLWFQRKTLILKNNEKM